MHSLEAKVAFVKTTVNNQIPAPIQLEMDSYSGCSMIASTNAAEIVTPH